jgi:hypothetical protein
MMGSACPNSSWFFSLALSNSGCPLDGYFRRAFYW